MDKMFAFIDSANDWLWSCVVKVLLVNLVAFFLLYPKVSALLKDYMCQKSKGLDPTFKASGDSIDDTPAWKE